MVGIVVGIIVGTVHRLISLLGIPVAFGAVWFDRVIAEISAERAGSKISVKLIGRLKLSQLPVLLVEGMAMFPQELRKFFDR